LTAVKVAGGEKEEAISIQPSAKAFAES